MEPIAPKQADVLLPSLTVIPPACLNKTRHSLSFKLSTLVVMAVLSLSFLPTAKADEGKPSTGRPIVAARKVSMCEGCHGIPGYRTSFPEVYTVPKLGGQHANYIVTALKAYQSGERDNATMHSIAEGLSEQDMLDIAAYYSISK